MVASVPKRFLATSSALRLVSSSCLRRLSSLSLRASEAARSARSDSSRVRRTRASCSARERSSCSRSWAPASAWARALRSSSVSVRSTTPEVFGAAAGAAGVVVAGALALAGAAACFGVALRSGATGSALPSAGPMRRLTFSTTTALLRPWLKLWRTTPCSTPPRLSVSVFVELTLSLSPLFLFVSVIRIHF